MRTRRLLTLKTTQRTQFVALDWMNARGPSLGPADMQTPGGELGLVPLQIAHLGGAQPMAVGDQDHGGVAMPVPARLAGHLHQLLDLFAGLIFPGSGN